MSEAASDSSSAPIVIKPSKRSLGHSVTTYLASLMSSDSSRFEEGARGEKPDFESSPDVLTWIKTFKGDARSEGRALFSAFAALIEFRVWMQYKFGMAAHNSEKKNFLSREVKYEPARFLTLLDCNVPMKCQRISEGS